MWPYSHRFPVAPLRTEHASFAEHSGLRRPRPISAPPLSMFLCTLGIGPYDPCSVSTEYSPGVKTPRPPAPLRHVNGFPVLRLSGQRRRPSEGLASVCRSNWTCSFPASSFHKNYPFRADARDGINAIRCTRPICPYKRVSGNCFHAMFRQRLLRCDHIRRTIQRSKRWKSLRT